MSTDVATSNPLAADGAVPVSAAAYLSPVPRPPHDPRRLRLDHRAGWRAASLDDVVLRADVGHFTCGGIAFSGASPASALELAPRADAVVVLGGGHGSFGGLSAPSNVTIAPDGGLLLLDPGSGRLKRFDGCTCTFLTVPCTGGIGTGPRELQDPGGIATCDGNLLIADAGNRRLSVYSLYGYLLRGFWTPPPGATANPWRPVAVATHRGRIAVADHNNGAVHLFNRAGVWQLAREGLGVVNALTFDCAGRLYVASDGNDAVQILDGRELAPLGTAIDPVSVGERFAPLPFTVEPTGWLELSALCTDRSRPARFDLNGKPPPRKAQSPGQIPAHKPSYLQAGSYTSSALDSRLYKCEWDRVQIELDVPLGTSVRLRTFTAEVALTDTEVDALPETSWQTAPRVTAASVTDRRWDALVRSEAGRYLWLRLGLSGDGFASPRIASLEVDFPRISLRRYLPAVFGEEPVSRNFTDRLLAIFDRGFRQIERRNDRSAELFDPLSAPAEPGAGDFLSWLATWVDVTLDRQLPLERRRRILKSAGALFKFRGTKLGLRQMLDLYLGLDERSCDCPEQPACGPCTVTGAPVWQPPRLILEHFSLRRWLYVGAGRLGEQSRLWGQRIVNRSQLGSSGGTSGAPAQHGARSGAQLGVTQLKTSQDPLRDPFHVYAHRFSVFLPAWLGRVPERRQSIARLVAAEKPAHSAAEIVYVEPRFRVGVQSMIGYDSVIGCYPQGVEVEAARLGRATVLGEAGGGDSPLRIGRKARIGASTRL